MYRTPASDYKTVREKTAVQKRSSKKSLSTLLAKTRTSSPVSGEADPYGIYTGVCVLLLLLQFLVCCLVLCPVVTTPSPTAPLYLQALVPNAEDQMDTIATEKTTNEESTGVGIDQSELPEGDSNEPMDMNDSSSVQNTAETYENPFLKPAKRIKLKYTGL